MEEKSQNRFKTEENLQKIINFGLTLEEAAVYLSLLKRGERGEVVGKIKNELELGRTTIYGIMERLNEKNWIESEEISSAPKRIKYIAKPPLFVINKLISQKEEELKQLKENGLLIGDKLDLVYQGSKNLTIDTIHSGGYKYLKPLVDMGWKIKSEVIEHIEPQRRLVLDYELRGKKGIPRECGLIIFRYEENIEKNDVLINEALNMLKTKSEYEIRKDKIPGFEDIILEDIKINKYPGVNVYIKLKLKKTPWLVGKEVAIPIQNKIFLIHGNKINFQILMDTLLNADKFHHLV